MNQKFNLIPLTRGLFAKVSAEDFAEVSKHKWLAQHTDHNQGRYYAARRDNKNKQYPLMHRTILGAKPGEFVDHINHDSLDNRRENLRICSPQQNACNKRKGDRNKLSQYKGVAFVSYLNRSSPWMAFISIHGKRKYLGYFTTEEAAMRAYNAAAIELHGEFACLN